jgi:hypothetical protein
MFFPVLPIISFKVTVRLEGQGMIPKYIIFATYLHLSLHLMLCSAFQDRVSM